MGGSSVTIWLRKFDEGPRELTSFTEEMRRHDLVAKSRILSQSIIEADARVADALRVPLFSPIFVLKRVRVAGGEPMNAQTAHIPGRLVPGLEVREESSLYELLQTRYHLYAARAHETYFAALAPSPAAELLGVWFEKPNQAAFGRISRSVRASRTHLRLRGFTPGGFDMPQKGDESDGQFAQSGGVN